jgi:outer membrane protein assembly factor BamB
MHRGGPQLQGRAETSAPSKVVLAWTFSAGKPIKGPAAVAQGRVFVGDDAGVVHAIDLASGKEQWSFKTEGAIEATPLVLDGTIFIGSSDANLYAIDAVNGSLKWKYATGDKILGGANYGKAADGKGTWIFVGSYDASLHCVDAASGKAVWTHSTDNYINGTPAVLSSGEVIFGGCDSFIHVVRTSDGKELRQIDSEAYIASSVAVADGIGYVGNYGNIVLAFDVRAGTVLWKYRDRNFPYFSSAALTDDRLIIGGRDKRLHCLDRATGKAIWHFQTRGSVDSSPVICGSAVIVGSEDGRLYCVISRRENNSGSTKSVHRSLHRQLSPATGSSSGPKMARFTALKPGNETTVAFGRGLQSGNRARTALLPMSSDIAEILDHEKEHDKTEAGNYFVATYPPFSFWSADKAARVQALLDQPPVPGVPLGIYFHVPFCRKRCHFCYFRVYTDKNAEQIREYLDAAIDELRLYARAPLIRGRKPRFVYFGGGTPSYLSVAQLSSLTDRMKALLPWDDVEEVTFECEPGTLTEQKLAALLQIGVTRLSLGVENFDAHILEINGRAHRTHDIHSTKPSLYFNL